MQSLPHTRIEVDQPLSRPEAEAVAWRLYGTADTAAVELLLVAHNPDVSTLKRYQASMALEWFDPSVDLPRARDDDDEPEAVKLLKVALLHGDMPVRIAAGDEIAAMLKPTSVWATAGTR